ncbi:MAG: alpha/beta hydrolase family protein [Gaiellaceae bacterium]
MTGHEPQAPIRGTAGGVPYVALPPADGAERAPLVVAWHLASPPRSEAAMAAALPLRGLEAWRVYLGLPMLGSRLPEGGLDEFFRRFREDMVLSVFEPVIATAVAELRPALAELRDRLPVGDGPVGLVGGSMGAWVAQSVVTDTELPVSAVALVSPAIRLESVVARYQRWWKFRYSWNEESRSAAERLDFVARAHEIAERDVATLLVVGALDDTEGFLEPAEQLRRTLSPERTSLVQIPGMGHPLAEEPGLEPAPQTAHASQVDAAIVDWFRRHLNASGPGGEPEARGRQLGDREQ